MAVMRIWKRECGCHVYRAASGYYVVTPDGEWGPAPTEQRAVMRAVQACTHNEQGLNNA